MIGKSELQEIARLLGFPCDLPEVEATIHSQDIGWCEKKCGKSTAEQCWQKYFEIIRRTTVEKILEKKQIVFEFMVKEITDDVCDKPVEDEPKQSTAEKAFANCPWYKFAEITRTGKIREFCKVGDMKTIKLKTGELIRVAIAGFDHDIDENGRVLPVTLTFVDCLNETFSMNQTATNKSGWKGCAMRIKTMTEIFERLPDDLKNFIVACKKDNATTDKLFLPSEVEVWGKNWYSKDDTSNKQYEFFKDKYNRIKFRTDNEEYSSWWWLRSPCSGGNNIFCVVNSNGSYYYNFANYSGGVAPCFAIV